MAYFTYHGNQQPSFLGAITHCHILGGRKTFIFHGFGVQGYMLINGVLIAGITHLISFY